MKKSIIALSILLGTIGYGIHELNNKALSLRYKEYQVKQELKSTYSEYNMLVKNKKHGAPIPQARLDILQVKSTELKAKIKFLYNSIEIIENGR